MDLRRVLILLSIKTSLEEADCVVFLLTTVMSYRVKYIAKHHFANGNFFAT